MNRGLRRSEIFVDPASRTRFIGLVSELPSRFQLEVHAFALMPNHYHLMLRSVRGNLSKGMRWVGAQFTQWTNRVQGWDGPIFRGRFRNRVVCADAYWRHLFAYVQANPLRAGIDESSLPEPWTSRDAFLRAEPPPWLTIAEQIACFGSTSTYLEYESAMLRGEPVAPSGFEPSELWAPHESGVIGQTHPLPRPTLDEALSAVGELVRVPVSELLQVTPSQPNVAQWMATWWVAHGTGIGQSALARQLGVTQQAVNRRVRKLERLRTRDRSVDAMMTALNRRLLL